MIVLDKFYEIIADIKSNVEKMSAMLPEDILPEDKKELAKQLIKEAVLAYGRAMINEAMKSE